MSDYENNYQKIQLDQIKGDKLLGHFPIAEAAELTMKGRGLKHLTRLQEPEYLDARYPAKTIEVFEPNAVDVPSGKTLACLAAISEVEKALEDELAECIPLLARHGCKVEAHNVNTTPEHNRLGNLTRSDWLAKAQQREHGSTEIFHDLTLLWEKLLPQMVASNTQMAASKSSLITLVVPVTHIPFLLTKTSEGESAFAMLQAVLPQVELLAVPQINDKAGNPCALLLCNNDAFGPVGYMAVEGNFTFKPQLNSDDYGFTLHIPSHKLALINPAQVAVLTGI